EALALRVGEGFEEEGMDDGVDRRGRSDADHEGNNNEPCGCFGVLPGLPCLREVGGHETTMLAHSEKLGARTVAGLRRLRGMWVQRRGAENAEENAEKTKAELRVRWGGKEN